MQYTTTLTQKGQATIPAPIRKKLGLKPNSKVRFELNKKNEAVIKPEQDLSSLMGSLKTKKKFNMAVWDEAIEKYVAKEYAKKLNRH